MMDPQLITIVIPFSGSLTNAEQALDNLWGNVAKPRIREVLDRLALVHFMGIHALPGKGSHHLVFELTLDGSADRVLAALAQDLEPELRALFQACDICPPRDIEGFLNAHRCQVGLGYFDSCGLNFSGTPGFSVRRIRAEAELAAWVSEQLAQRPRLDSALDKLKTVRASLWKDQSLKWAFEEEALLSDTGALSELRAAVQSIRPLLRELLWPLLVPPALALGAGLIGGPVVSLGSAALASLPEVALVAALYRRFRRNEQSDAEDTVLPSGDALRECTQREDQIAQNHLIVLSDLKPGVLRKLSLRLALFAVRQAATLVFPPGKLSDIGTIHFARWIVLPGTSQLLFLSNYGGSWDSYLEDFIVKAHMGLTGVWSNTLGFPKASNLFCDGATNGSAFKAWARRQQRPTRFWYSAYPSLTTSRIRTNAAIRQGIAAPTWLNAEAAQRAAERWYALFGAKAPDAQPRIDAEQVPALVFGGLSKSKISQAWLLRFASAQQARDWLASVADNVSYGEDSTRTRVFSVGFCAAGLRKLGVEEPALRTFPIAFQENSARRAAKLGDAPNSWTWGGEGATAVDAIALLYAADAAEFADLAAEVDQSCVVRTIDLQERGQEMREPFGFVDGISQPSLRGTRKGESAKRRDQMLAAGEVVLGYADNSSYTPRTPSVSANSDAFRVLPKCADDAQAHDLGRNGTFLVVRQLHQDVAAFDEYLTTSAADSSVKEVAPAGVDPKEWVAAKLMGRWRNGSSLVRYPNGPGPDTVLDNDFRYGVEDPDGVACPFGAHTRRANPRDSFNPASADALTVTNRHRILRVGRVYNENHRAAGMLFMCLNADIERQFEFIQQTWLRAPSFHGLNNEVDPLAVGAKDGARGLNVMTVPTDNGPLTLRALREFIRVVGSGYFFLPGRQALRYLTQREQAPMRAQAVQAAE